MGCHLDQPFMDFDAGLLPSDSHPQLLRTARLPGRCHRAKRTGRSSDPGPGRGLQGGTAPFPAVCRLSFPQAQRASPSKGVGYVL